MEKADIGLIGMAVMGQNLVLNMCDHGFTVAVFNRTVSKVDEFMDHAAKGFSVVATHSEKEFIQSLKRPRKVMLMVKAGKAVDAFIDKLLPYLEEGDIIIDGGNSLYTDTQRRYESLQEKKILFVGTGISGGEEGARHGPSIMPGGNPKAWEFVKPILQSIAAKVENQPCCDWVGQGGAGHYVKMVHNGIEYGDMQLICEAYAFLKEVGYSLDELADIFKTYNKSELDSYLIEITAQILQTKDKQGKHQLDQILDVAGQKGTGKWTVMNALEMNLPLTLIAEAVFARNLSGFKQERKNASKAFPKPKSSVAIDKKKVVDQVKNALYASKIMSYAQGFMLMKMASEAFKWDLNYGSIALMWRGGCIIRSQFLQEIKKAYDTNKKLENLLLDEFFKQAIEKAEPHLRKVVSMAALSGIPMPCFFSALTFFDGYRTENLPANLLQAQRDFFGAHTYERIDQPRGEFFHFDWVKDGKEVKSHTYNA